MSRNVLLLGGPANGQMVNVEDGATAVHVCDIESVLNVNGTTYAPMEPLRVDYYLYLVSDTDKNVFNYAH